MNPTCHSDVAHSLGNAVFNHAGVGGISSDIVQEGNHPHSDVFRVQLIAGVGSAGQMFPGVTVGRPAHGRAREPAWGRALQRVPMAAALHLHHGDAEGFGRENRERVKTRQVIATGHEIPNCSCQSQVFLGFLLLSITALPVAKPKTGSDRALYRLGHGRMTTGDLRTPRTWQSGLTGSAEVLAQL